MAIDNYKVTTSEVGSKNVKSAPDVLTSDAQTNKNWFDRLVEYFILKYNGLIDYLQSNLVGREAAGRGLTYKDDRMNWRYAVDKGSSFGFSFSGNIEPTQGGGYETTIADDLYITQTDLMDCFMYINDVEYECGDSWADGVLFYTKTVIGTTEVRLTYNSLTHELVMSSTSNPLDTTYWNVEVFRGVAEKVKRKSLPGELTNDAYTELKDRIDGLTGEIGKTIANTVIEYGVSDSEATPPSAWQPTPPVVTAGQWMWVKTTTIYNDLSETTTYSKSYIGTDGEDGISVTVQSVVHYDTYTIVTLVDSDGNTSTIRIDDGADGTDGQDAPQGYVHFAWANSADGSVDFSTHESFGKSYLGTCYDTNQSDPQDYQAYTWTLIKGADGRDGIDGTDGRDGTDGKTIKSLVHQYYISMYSSYKYGGSWSNTLNYVSGRYVWTRDKITYDDDSVEYTPSEAGVYNSDITDKSKIQYDTEQHFWVKSTGGTTSVPNGAYVTRVARESFDNGTGYSGTPTGPNLLMRSDDLQIRSADKVCTLIDGSGMELFGEVDSTQVSLAKYSSNTRIGRPDKARIEVTPSELQMITDVNAVAFNIKSDPNSQEEHDVSITVDTGRISSGTTMTISAVSAISSGTPFEFYMVLPVTLTPWKPSFTKGTSSTATRTQSGRTWQIAYTPPATFTFTGYSDFNVRAVEYKTTTYATEVNMTGTVGIDGDIAITGGITPVSGQLDITDDLGVSGRIISTNHRADNASAIGYIQTSSETISVANTTSGLTKRGNGITLAKGTWIVTMGVSFPSNSTGVRRCAIGSSSAEYSGSRQSTANTAGYDTYLESTLPINITASSTTFYAYLQQNSGGALSTTVYWRAVRII